MTAIGALNVGSIVFGFDPELKTNQFTSKRYIRDYDYKNKKVPTNLYDILTLGEAQKDSCGIELNKGQEMGYFKMGSTIALIFEAPQSQSFFVKSGEKISLGQKLF